MPRCFENGNGDFGPEAFRAIHCAQLSTKLMVKRFHGSRRFIFTGSWSATHVLLSFVGSELPRGLGAYVSPYLYSAINVQCSYEKTK